MSKRSSLGDVALVAEPEARANSFVGTEEYLAPEIIQGQGHGAEVDWSAVIAIFPFFSLLSFSLAHLVGSVNSFVGTEGQALQKSLQGQGHGAELVSPKIPPHWRAIGITMIILTRTIKKSYRGRLMAPS